MSVLNIEATVGQLVTELPNRSRIFETLGIDYCCGGKKTLSQACAEKGLDSRSVVRLLDLADMITGDPDRDWSKTSMTELIQHIESTHHAYLKRELPRLAKLVQKVAIAHGAAHPELIQVRDIFGIFAGELALHMSKEESVLFPAIRRLESGDGHGSCGCGSLENPIHAMEHEHEDAGRDLAMLRQLTHNFVPPTSACNTYRALLAGLEELEKDMHRHVHKENSILFPKAAAAERTQGMSYSI